MEKSKWKFRRVISYILATVMVISTFAYGGIPKAAVVEAAEYSSGEVISNTLAVGDIIKSGVTVKAAGDDFFIYFGDSRQYTRYTTWIADKDYEVIKIESSSYGDIRIQEIASKQDQTITASDVTMTYGDSAKAIGATTSGDGTLSYSVLNESDVISVDESGNVTANKAGSASIKITASETNTYKAAEKTISVTVNKANPTITASDQTMTYGDSSKAIGATTNGGTLSYEVTSGTDVISVNNSGSISIIKAGSAQVKITAAENDNYLSGDKTISVTVNKANPEMQTNPAAVANLIYNGEAQALVSAGIIKNTAISTASTENKLQYKISAYTGATQNVTTDWSDDIPTGTAAGTYTIGYRIVDNTTDQTENFYPKNTDGTAIGTVTVEIAKFEAVVTPDENQSKKYGEADPELTYTVAAKNAGQTLPTVDFTNGMFNKGTLAREKGEPVGEYAFDFSAIITQNNDNYEVTVTENPATFEIERKQLTDEDILLVAKEPGRNGSYNSVPWDDENGFEYKYTGEVVNALFDIYYIDRAVDANGNKISGTFNPNRPTSRSNNAFKIVADTDYVYNGVTTEKEVTETPNEINFRGEGNFQGNIASKWSLIANTFDVRETVYSGTYDGEEHEALEVHPTPSSNYTKEEKTYEYILLGKEEMSAEGFDGNSVLNDPEAAWEKYADKATADVPMIKDVNVDADGNAVPYIVLYKITMHGHEDYYGAAEPMIEKKSVKLVANDTEPKVYDNDPSTDPELTFEDYTDQLIEADAEAISAAVEIAREEGQDVGEYDIYFNIDDLDEAFTNYDFSEEEGTFEITKRTVNISVESFEKVYSDEFPEVEVKMDMAGDEGVAEDEGVIAGDEDEIQYTLKYTKGGTDYNPSRTLDVGEYEINLRRRVTNKNYNLQFGETATLTVTPKNIEDKDVKVTFNGKTDESCYECTFNGKEYSPTIGVQHFVDDTINCVKYGKELASGGPSTPDYRITGTEYATEIGCYIVTIEGLNNYEGTRELVWAILPMSLETETVYNGKEQSPEFLDGFVPQNYANLFTMEYAGEDEEYSSELPKYVDVKINDEGKIDSYPVYYKITFNPEEFGTTEAGDPIEMELSTQFTIQPAELILLYPYADKEYDGTTAIRFEDIEAEGVTVGDVTDELLVSFDATLDEADSDYALNVDDKYERPVSVSEKQCEEAVITAAEGSEAKPSNYKLSVKEDEAKHADGIFASVTRKVLYNINDEECDGNAYISAKATDRMYNGTADIDATIEVVTGVEGEEITFNDVITDNETIEVKLDEEGNPVATDIAVTGIAEAAEGTNLDNYVYYVDGLGYPLGDTRLWDEENPDLWTGEVDTEVVISPAEIKVSADSITKTYDGKEVKASDIKFTVTGFDGIEDEAAEYYNENKDKAAAFDFSGKTAKNAGTYSVKTVVDAGLVDLISNDNYVLETVDPTVTINKKAVTVTVKDATKVAGQADPTFKYSADGLVAGESLKNAKVSRKVGETAGTYELTLSCDADPNYTFKFVKGTFTITAAPAPGNPYSGEWVKGQWYGADGNTSYKPQGSWKQNATGWWYEDTAGWYPQSQWQKIDGLWYYFGADGYMASSEWIDGYWLDSDGAWRYEPRGSWNQDSTGWWYGDTSGWYAGHGWQKIDGKYYFFNESGYMVTSQYVGNDWVGEDGAWIAE